MANDKGQQGSAVAPAGSCPTGVRTRGMGAVIFVVVAVALLIPGMVACGRYYPYCLSYYSEVIGGLRGAARLGMEVTYWGDAYGGAREFMSRPENAHARFYAANEFATGVVDALIGAGEVPPQHRLFGRFVTGRIPSEADWVLVDNYPPLWPPAVRELVASRKPEVTVSREGVPLLWIFSGPHVKSPGGSALRPWLGELGREWREGNEQDDGQG